MDNISKHIKKIYVQKDYFSKYGPDVLVSLLIILFFSVLIIYFLLKSSLGDIKEKLKKNRCDAKYIFFSGWVSKKENQTPLMATMENMTICLNDLIYSVFLVFVEPVLSMTTNLFNQNFMQIGLTGVTAAQASSLNMININLHVGMRLFQEHLKLLFVPIIKLNHIINDSLEKFVLILQLIIKSLEVHQLNIKHIILSMYKALLQITVKSGNAGVEAMNKSFYTFYGSLIMIYIGLITAPFGLALAYAGFFGLIVSIIMLTLSYIIYLSTFGAGKKAADKFYKNIIELYPDINLDSPKHKGIDVEIAIRRAKREARQGPITQIAKISPTAGFEALRKNISAKKWVRERINKMKLS
jgi:hypothetical protein